MNKQDNNAALTGTFMLIGGLILTIISAFAGWEAFGIICSICMVAGLIIVFIAGRSE